MLGYKCVVINRIIYIYQISVENLSWINLLTSVDRELEVRPDSEYFMFLPTVSP